MRINKGKLFEESLKFISRRMLLKFSYANKKASKLTIKFTIAYLDKEFWNIFSKKKKIDARAWNDYREIIFKSFIEICPV